MGPDPARLATDIVRLQLSPESPLCALHIRDKSHYAGRRHKMTTIAGREGHSGEAGHPGELARRSDDDDDDAR